MCQTLMNGTTSAELRRTDATDRGNLLLEKRVSSIIPGCVLGSWISDPFSDMTQRTE